MIESKTPTLYSLLPAVYRQQDQLNGLVLQALFTIMQSELQNVQTQIDLAYENYFIETCETWAEPYIGDMLGIQGIHNSTVIAQQRVRIANTIRYRRRKGQQGVLESVINDVTGWNVHIAIFMQTLAMTQYLQNVRLSKSKTMEIRNIYSTDTLNTPFDVNAHRADVHSKDPIYYNLNNVGLYIWRLTSYPINKGTAVLFSFQANIAAYWFDPIGRDCQLFNASQRPDSYTVPAIESQLPVAIRRLGFQQDLMNYQLLPAEQQSGNSDYYGPNKSIYLTVNGLGVPANKIISADLSNWAIPPQLSTDQMAAIDVKLGRFMIYTEDSTAPKVTVNYYYAFSADLGGGHYDRVTLLSPVTNNTVLVSGGDNALKNAIDLWNSNQTLTTIQIQDDATYFLSPQLIANTFSQSRSLIIQANNETRPCIKMSGTDPLVLSFQGQTSASNPQILEVKLNGLKLEGYIDLKENVHLTITHCSLIPKAAYPSLLCQITNSSSTVNIDNSILGALFLSSTVTHLNISQSIIDGQQQAGQVALAALNDQSQPLDPGPNSSLDSVTVLGSVFVSEINLLSNSIVTGLVKANRSQNGIVRFSYLPLNSQTPPRYQCLPDLDFIPLAQKLVPTGESYTLAQQLNPTWWDNTLRQLQPQFTSVTYGEPGYVQLNINTSTKLMVVTSITVGADNGSEMGCFNSLNQPQRQAQLTEILQEYSPFGVATGVFYVT